MQLRKTQSIAPHLYDEKSCEIYWDKTVDGLWEPWKKGISRALFASFSMTRIGHTPMWLRISNNRLHCVQHPDFSSGKHHIKIYRALHYINRLNRILRSRKIANNTEWLCHHADSTKLLKSDETKVPVFSVSGNKEFYDIPAIPFMSFSDKLSGREYNALKNIKLGRSFDYFWSRKTEVAFFRGALSDCDRSIANVSLCARVKLVHHAKYTRDPLLSEISTTSNLRDKRFSTLLGGCKECQSASLDGEGFARELVKHKYLLNLRGAGNWSRRLGILLNAGSVIFQSESSGFQFYEIGLEPGVHYIPFDIQIGHKGVGNLISRLVWAKKNDKVVKVIAKRAESFGKVCLNEASIDYFTHKVLDEYSHLLRGDLVDYPNVDLSSCIKTSKDQSIARLCKEVVRRCWK
jgi:hypothetical protein